MSKFGLVSKVSVLLVLSSLACHAQSDIPGSTLKKYKIRGAWVEFTITPEQHLTLSRSCKERQCQAFKTLAKSSLEGLDELLKGGAHPGAVVCRKLFHAELQVGLDEDGNETGFCRFGDGSLVGTGSIAYYASQTAK